MLFVAAVVFSGFVDLNSTLNTNLPNNHESFVPGTWDVVFIALTIVLFALSAAYVRACEKL